MTSDTLKYPIGKFKKPNVIYPEHILEWITVLEFFPEKLTQLVSQLNPRQLDTPYRKKGWTIRQVVHHLADSHSHSYIRFKWALTEDKPVIKYYFEDLWAELIDAKKAPIQLSLNHLSAIHAKLVYLLKTLSETDLEKSFIHPEHNEEVFLKTNIGIYAWHCNHHYAHIKQVMLKHKWI